MNAPESNVPGSVPALAPAPGEPFVSFSINYEDVVLRRLFRGRATGFFVDVGAEHPVLGNDFYGFYTSGWTGISVEPNAAYFALLQEHRPRDRNLQVALSDVAGEDLVFFEVSDTGLSTCDEAQAAACLAKGHTVTRHDVRSSTLKDVLDSAGASHVDILKVDVEGFEERVLLGNDWERYRPSIIMVEVTYPETSVRRPTNIQRNLEALGYRHIYFDNLNDFFADASFDVSEEAILPPNVFDNFVQHGLVALRDENTSLRSNFSAAETYARALEAEHGAIKTEARALQAECGALRDSLASVTQAADALGRERTALHDSNALLDEAARHARAALAAVQQVALASILGRPDKVRALLTHDDATILDQRKGRPMPQESKELVTIAGEGITDGFGQTAPPGRVQSDLEAELLAAQLQAADERNRSLINDIDDLQHEKRRMLAALSQTQGENTSLRRGLGPSYATRDELVHLCDEIASLRSEVRDHCQSMAIDVAACVRAALIEEGERTARHRDETSQEQIRGRGDNADVALLRAMQASTSWRVTRPLRALGRLFSGHRR